VALKLYDRFPAWLRYHFRANEANKFTTS
jgi:hypothetical protein